MNHPLAGSLVKKISNPWNVIRRVRGLRPREYVTQITVITAFAQTKVIFMKMSILSHSRHFILGAGLSEMSSCPAGAVRCVAAAARSRVEMTCRNVVYQQ